MIFNWHTSTKFITFHWKQYSCQSPSYLVRNKVRSVLHLKSMQNCRAKQNKSETRPSLSRSRRTLIMKDMPRPCCVKLGMRIFSYGKIKQTFLHKKRRKKNIERERTTININKTCAVTTYPLGLAPSIIGTVAFIIISDHVNNKLEDTRCTGKQQNKNRK